MLLVAHIPLYLYPFLNTVSKNRYVVGRAICRTYACHDRPFEYLRLTSLGVIGALVKVCMFIFVELLSSMEYQYSADG